MASQLIYGATGTTSVPEIAAATANVLKSGNLLLVLGEIFVFVGLGFKVSGKPFQQCGRRTSMKAHPHPRRSSSPLARRRLDSRRCCASSAFGGLAVIDSSNPVGTVAVIAALTMTLGNVVALGQTNVEETA